jgi:signal transduction histidine kinase
MIKYINKFADRVRWGYFIALLLLLVSYFMGFYTVKKAMSEAKWINQAHKVIHNADRILSRVRAAESGLRGYIITADSTFLSLYNTAPALIDSLFTDTYQKVSDNPIQRRRLDTLKEQINAKFALSDGGINIFKANGYKIPDSMRAARKGKVLMDDIKRLVYEISDEENRLLSYRSEQLTRFSHLITIVNITSLIVAIVIIWYSLLFFNKENSARRKADQKAAEYQQQLEARVTELDKLNAELVELKSMEKFALTGRISRTIAHEVRNPLTNINLALEQLKVDLTVNEDTAMLLDMISRNSARINQLISDLLNSTRANLLAFDDANIHTLLDETIELAQDRIELKKIKVIKQYADGICNISVDIQKIKIAFLNIIVNAIEAMEEGAGVLTVRTETKDSKCVVLISDNGKGIPAEDISRLFEPYYTTKENGTGLGLTNTQNIILSHKASISVQSESGKGTTFMITFNVKK